MLVLTKFTMLVLISYYVIILISNTIIIITAFYIFRSETMAAVPTTVFPLESLPEPVLDQESHSYLTRTDYFPNIFGIEKISFGN